jgi:uncharacterized protein
MSQSDKDLDGLHRLLSRLPVAQMPMTVSELDGFVTGILACPDMMSPSLWLHHVWGENGTANFADLDAAQETIDAVMRHYNAVAQVMTRSLWIEPIYEIDPNSDDVLWEPWVDGFMRAMALNPKAWTALLARADGETAACIQFLHELNAVYIGESDLSEEEISQLDEEAPDMIPNCVAAILHQSRPELVRPEPANLPDEPFRSVPRPGRNDPCSCGSRRKYKQCCGRN